jgi:uncharacterized phiE125 gp8 family phage protein
MDASLLPVYIRTAAPSSEPVTVDEAKLAARIDGTAFDALLPGMIAGARQIAEQETGRKFITQTWRLDLADWPSCTGIRLERSPFISVGLVQYWGGAGWLTLATSQYKAVQGQFFTSIERELNVTWPTLVDAVGHRVRVAFDVGYGNAAAVPECIKLYIKAMVTYWVQNPQAATERGYVPAPFLGSLLDPERVFA